MNCISQSRALLPRWRNIECSRVTIQAEMICYYVMMTPVSCDVIEHFYTSCFFFIYVQVELCKYLNFAFTFF